MCVRIHKYTHTHTHTHACTCTHTHTHTHGTGGKVNLKDSQWLTPLHHAAARGHKNTVKTLLKNHADVMARDKNWMTPLHLAAHNNHLEVAGEFKRCECLTTLLYSIIYTYICVSSRKLV